MKTLIEAANIQLKMEATGSELLEIPSQICESTAAQYEKHDAGRGSAPRWRVSPTRGPSCC